MSTKLCSIKEIGFILSLLIIGQGIISAQQIGIGDEVVIKNVSLITMEREAVVPNQTVIIANGVIQTIGPFRELKIPENSKVIDGSGKYLMPGLYDMHMHFLSDDRIDEKYLEDELLIPLSYGVVGQRVMIGKPEHLDIRDKIKKGELLGPQLFVASPQLSAFKFSSVFNGKIVENYEQGYKAVEQFEQEGYDFIKLTFGLDEDTYQGIVDAASERGISVIGHVSRKIKLEKSLKSGQDIEHLDQYMDAIVGDDSPFQEGLSAFGIFKDEVWETVNFIDSTKIEKVTEMTVENEVWNTPTNYLFISSFAEKRSQEELESSPEWKFLSDEVKEELLKYRKNYWNEPPHEEYRKKYIELRSHLIIELYRRSGKIMAGSDAPEWLTLYGSGLHRELQNLVEIVGLTPYEALTTATTKPAEYLGRNKSGMIKEGYRADLVLMDRNPLQDIRNLDSVEGLILNGIWLSEKELSNLTNRAKRNLKTATLREGN